MLEDVDVDVDVDIDVAVDAEEDGSSWDDDEGVQFGFMVELGGDPGGESSSQCR